MAKGKSKGSVTVEAAFILPMVIFIILTLIYLGFYLHDRCRMEGIVDLALQKGAFTAKHESDFESGRVDYENIGDRGVFYPLFGDREAVEEQVLAYLWEEVSKGFFATEITDIHVTVDRLKITIIMEGDFRIPVQGILDYFHANQSLNVEAARPIHNPAEFIRVSEVVLDTGSKVKGLGSRKESIDKVLGR